ncbi:GNAT family N-acetyltransferase [Rubinisphaera sp.]|uniref:GNAT family N-acetyltransferase n=1 Tax=Rubinisphaera sp. TaxID=2024857 RepID=UPI000C0D2EB3|nr:GNAT family N-acetyltransferase [Rubinisphaera sp.]MBV08488.1 GNAT family N-acetyltransferase [Rubinisphaera sp.]HCS51440.1 N-acetyltransferase [Planctomycetaceae bacterium]
MNYLLETERLRFRQMGPADIDFLAELLSNPQVVRFYPKVYTREESFEWIERQMGRYQEFGHGLWLLERQVDGTLIGQAGVVSQNIENEVWLEVGYMIHSKFWKQGYASEAAIACRDYAFHILNAEKVCSLIQPANIASQRVALKNQMKPHRLVQHYEKDHLQFVVSRSDL